MAEEELVEKAESTEEPVVEKQEKEQEPNKLKTALESERSIQKKLEAQLKAINKQAEDAKRELEEKSLSESEKHRKRVEELSESNKTLSLQVEALRKQTIEQEIDHEIFLTAQRLGFQYPEQSVKLVDRSLINRDEDTGVISGVKESLEKLLKSYKNLSANNGQGTPTKEASYQRVASGGGGSQQKIDPRADLLARGGYA